MHGRLSSPSTYGIAFVEEGPNATGPKLLFFDRAPNKGFLVSPIS
jgi:hypothetical protein